MSCISSKLWNELAAGLSTPIVLSEYFPPEPGQDYEVKQQGALDQMFF
jgi:hypothetical protein